MGLHTTSMQAQTVLCQPCLARQENVPLRPGEACNVCRQHFQFNVRNLNQTLRPAFETPIRTLSYSLGPQQAYINPDTPHASPLSTVLPPPPPFSLAYHTASQDRAIHFGQSTPPRMHSPARFTTTQATKAAQNDRHKLSEKHRRDGMGAFVQAGHALHDGLNPGLLAGCKICVRIEADDAHLLVAPLPNMPSSGSNSSADSENTSPLTGAKNKKPKNDMLEEGLMWQFSMILHHAPEFAGERLDRIRALAHEMDREKRVGMVSDHARMKKWSSDVRGEVLWDILARMEGVCRAHDVPFEGEPPMEEEVKSEWSRKRGIEQESEGCEDRCKRRDIDVPTPPSSRGSPLGDARRGSLDLEILR